MFDLQSKVAELEAVEYELSMLQDKRDSLRDEISEDIEEYFQLNQEPFHGPNFDWVPVRTRRFDYNKDLELEVMVNGQVIVATQDALEQALKALKMQTRVEKGQSLSIKRQRKQ